MACSSSTRSNGESARSTAAALSAPGSEQCAAVGPGAFGGLQTVGGAFRDKFNALNANHPGAVPAAALDNVTKATAKIDALVTWTSTSPYNATNASTASSIAGYTSEVVWRTLAAARTLLAASATGTLPKQEVADVIALATDVETQASAFEVDAWRCYMDPYIASASTSSDPGQAAMTVPTDCTTLGRQSLLDVQALLDRALADAQTPGVNTSSQAVTFFLQYTTAARDALARAAASVQPGASASDPATALAVQAAFSDVGNQLAGAHSWGAVGAIREHSAVVRTGAERTYLASGLAITAANTAAFCRMQAPSATLPPGTITPIPGYDSGVNACGPGILMGPQRIDSTGHVGYGGLSYPTAPNPNAPASCRVAIQYCDANNVPVAGPTEAQLNTTPAQLATCAPLAPRVTELPPLDPATVGATCQKTSDCANGQQCGVVCATPACDSVAQRCGTPLPKAPAANCDPNELRECADPRAFGTVTAADVTRGWQPYTPGADLVPDPVTVPKIEAYAKLDAISACNMPKSATPPEAENHKEFPIGLGNDEWGVSIDPFFDSKVSPGKGNILTNGELGGSAGVSANAYVMGNKIDVADIVLNATLGCESHGSVDFKLLGEAVAIWNEFKSFDTHLPSLERTSSGFAQPKAKADQCANWFKTRNDAVSELQQLAWAARYAKEYGKKFGTTSLCYPTKRNADPSIDCSDVSGAQDVKIIDAWRKKYEDRISHFKVLSKDYDVGMDKLAFGGAIALGELGNRKTQTIYNGYFPIGPVSINVVAEGYFEWHVRGEVQLAARWDGKPWDVFKIRDDVQSGDLRIFGGPRVTPGVTLGVSAYAGVGIPGVSIGIEGDVDLLKFDVPLDVRASLARSRIPDTRDVQASDWAGDPIDEMPVTTAPKWRAGFLYNADANLSALNGELDLAARIDLWIFEKTFRKKLFGWNGISDSWHLAGGPIIGDPIDFGITADKVAITSMKPIDPAEISQSKAAMPLETMPGDTCGGDPR